MKPLEARTLEAFLRAISKFDQPLPQDLESDIHQLSRALLDDAPEALETIPEVAKKNSDFYSLYKLYYRSLQENYQSTERAKSLASASVFGGGHNYDIESRISRVFDSEDIKRSAQKFLALLDSKVTDNGSKTKRSDFSRRGNHIVAIASGGAFLGALIAQVPGAVIGGFMAGIYAWTTSAQGKANRSS